MRTACIATLAVLVACTVATPALAAPIRVQASQDQSLESSFALDFGLGGVASALISRTDFELEVDGSAETARFLTYDQDIDPLLLPGSLSTGAIRVHIVPGSSTGTYNRLTGEFETQELYNIEFDGDLSAYGLFSPVILPSQSVGVVDVDSMAVGSVNMNWAGSNLNSPSIPLDFSYICTLFASFSTTAASFVDLEIITQVSGMTMSSEDLRTTLLYYLNTAMDSFNADDVRRGVGALRSFSFKAVKSAPGIISQDDANLLVSLANTAIGLATNPLGQVLIQPPNPTDKGGMNSSSIDVRGTSHGPE